MCSTLHFYQSCSSPTLVGWKDSCQDLKNEADFWYRVWEEAGRPSSGALFNIRKSTKRQYKASVCRIKRRKDYLVREKLAKSFSERRKTCFWSAVKKLRHQSIFRVSIVDGVTAPSDLANLFASNLSSLLNSNSRTSRMDVSWLSQCDVWSNVYSPMYAHTVEPLIMDTLKNGQPPYNGHTVRTAYILSIHFYLRRRDTL